MSAVKVSVSLDSEDLAWLRKQAKRRKKSLSAVLTESVRRARRERALDEVLTCSRSVGHLVSVREER